jgi:uncharacterized protein YacL
MFIYYLIAAIIFCIIIVLYFTKKLVQVPLGTFFAILTGVILGLLVGALFSIPLSRLPGDLGQWLPLVTSILLAIAGASLFIARKKTISTFVGHFFSGILEFEKRFKKEKVKQEEKGIVVDTSVIIDGRIEDIAKIGFISEKLIIPRFVLEELQKIADSSNPVRRNRGRRGLEILNTLSKKTDVQVEITDDDFPKVLDVDAKIVRVAKKRGRKILTTDYNLNRVAEIQKVKVLNINELANAIKTVVLPGEELQVKIIQEGKEKDQGVGYLDDGTMIVVEGGDKYIGDTVKCQVTRIFQTVAGKMVFTKPKEVVEKK